MSCHTCRDMKIRDHAVPRCETPGGCLIPPLGPEEARVLEMRALLVSLAGLVSPEAILRISGATLRQLEKLAYLQEMLEEVFRSDDQAWH